MTFTTGNTSSIVGSRGLPPIPFGNYHQNQPNGQRYLPDYQRQISGIPEPWRGEWSTNMPLESRSGRQSSPPFEDTKIIREMVNARGQRITPDISASIPKGFFEVEGKWTCYRRNYFPVLCSFGTKPQVPDGIYYLQRDGHQPAQVIQFAVSISAKTAVLNNQDSQSRGLVQHTPKRDKATESTPGKVVIQPATQMPSSIHSYSSPQHVSPDMIVNFQPFADIQQQSPPKQHTFERIQFQKATANNGKRRAQQQFFHVVVELWADVGRMGKSEWIEIATRQSAQMVVRGRSPGHYKDNGRRDSTTSMDPDRGTGAGGDGGNGGMHGMPPMMGGHSHSNGGMDWSSNGPGSNHHYGGGSYRRPGERHLSESNSSSCTFTGSPTKMDAEYESESRMTSPTDLDGNVSDSHYHTETNFEAETVGCSSSRKRSYEEDHSFGPSSFDSRRPYHIDSFLPTRLDHISPQAVPVS